MMAVQGYVFGANAIQRFHHKNRLQLTARAHQLAQVIVTVPCSL
jgi:hypothetical protein